MSLAPILRNERPQVRSAAVSYWRNATSIRTPTHRLIFQSDPAGPVTAVFHR